MQIVKVRKPRPLKYYGLAELFCRFKKRQDKFFANLPNVGENITITWLPNNNGERNAYIGFSGIVKSVCGVNGDIEVFSGSSTLIMLGGSFDYIKNSQ